MYSADSKKYSFECKKSTIPGFLGMYVEQSHYSRPWIITFFEAIAWQSLFRLSTHIFNVWDSKTSIILGNWVSMQQNSVFHSCVFRCWEFYVGFWSKVQCTTGKLQTISLTKSYLYFSVQKFFLYGYF